MNPETQQKMDLLHARTEGFRSVVASAQQTIYNALQHMKNPYISFSGGKDSLVMLHMILEQKRDIPIIYWDADASYPDTDKFLDRLAVQWNLDFKRIKTESMLSVFRKYGINHPQIEEKTMVATVYRPITKLMKRYKFDGVFVGLRGEESFGRRQLIKHRGQTFWNTYQQVIECLPVAYFKVEDIWAYIASRDLPYNSIYDRTSMCPRNEIRVSYYCGESAREFGRFVWLKKEYPELYNRFAAEFPEVREWV